MAQELQNKSSQLGSLNRAFLLLEAIASGSRKGSSLTELVARTSLPRPTIHRVLKTLIDHGWVIRDETSARFNLAMGLAALGYSAISRNPIEKIATTHLSVLAEQLNQVVYMGVRSGLDMVCIGRYESSSQIQVGQGRVGMRGPFGMSPSCLAMMSHLPLAEIESIISANLSRYHRIEGFDETGFRKAVDEAIKNGYSTYDSIILDRTTSAIGVAVCDPDGYPIAGIGTTYISGWLNEEQWQNCLGQLQKTAERISNDFFLNSGK
ncbi:MAG: transcriptional regulator [Betaproteobacteria bacterium HGW-Betaproteobacteria-12]|nr:MAG: transcriptional regulator [Betaproteobacteria bacterium HGW-Betaproteobacteria-12]